MKRLFNDKEKWCPHCKAMKLLEDFGVDNAAPSGRDCYCKKHRKEYSKKYLPHRRDYMRMTRYGLSKDKYQELYDAQNGVCAICLRERELCVDHDHKSGEVRGLLCSGCNIMLGHFDDDTDMFLRVIEYIRRSKKWPL